MNRFFTIVLLFILSVTTYSQNRPFYLMVNAPEYIPQNMQFEVSIFARISEANTKMVNFYLLVDDKVNINSAVLCSNNEKERLKYQVADFRGYLGKAYKVDLGLDSASSLFDSFFEVCVGFRARGVKETEIAFGLEVEFKDGAKEYFSSYDQFNESYPLPTVGLTFYKPQSLAGNSLELKNNSNLSFKLKNVSELNNLMIEFWSKLDSYSRNFFSIVNTANSDTLVSLSSNDYKIVSPNYKENVEVKNTAFLSKNAWTHYIVKLNKENGNAEVYANDKLLFLVPFDTFANPADLKFAFRNTQANNNLQVDLVKVWQFNNNIDLALTNKNYMSYQADSSRAYLNLTFDDSRALSKLNNLSNVTFQMNNVSLTLSDAPIFSQAPELNVYVYGSFYSIEWSNKEGKHAEMFVVERSFNGYEFTPIHRELSSDDPDKIYYYSDPKNVEDEIVIYRIKQINKDNTKIYSAQVKIGQGEKEPFHVGQNFPNPFNPTTQITVDFYESTEVEISVFNVVGKKLAKLHEGTISQGIHQFTFDGSNLPSGIYFFEVKSPSGSIVRKMILAK